MNIGLIFECGPQGADKQVCEYLAKKINPDAEYLSKTLDNKDNLLNQAAEIAKGLIKIDQCDRVLIIWDLRPSWPDMKTKPCRFAERQRLLSDLQASGLQNQSISLVCIEQEFESWLLADKDAVNSFLSRPTHTYNGATTVSRPDNEKNPKSRMIKYFKEARGFKYDDKVHAIGIVKQECLSLKKLRRSVSFSRFENKLQN